MRFCFVEKNQSSAGLVFRDGSALSSAKALLATEAQQHTVETQQCSMGLLLQKRVPKLGGRKGGLGLWIGDLIFPLKSGEFLPPALANGFGKLSIVVAGEIVKRRGVAVFFPHE